MDPRRRRRIGVGGAVVAAGSVWETRIQSRDDEVNKNAIFKAIHLQAVHEDKNTNKMSLKEAALGVNGKKRAWKSDVKSPSKVISRADSLKLTRPRSIGSTPPVTPRRSIGTTPPMTPRRSTSSDSNAKSLTMSVAAKKTRSDPVEGDEKTPGPVKKTRSELCTAIVKSGEFDTVPLRKVISLPAHNSDKSDKKTEDEVDVPKEETVEEKPQIPEEVKEFGVCQEVKVPVNSKDDEQVENGDHEEDEEEEEDDGEEEEKEVGNKSIDVKEMNVAKENINNRVGDDVVVKKYSQFHNRIAPSPSAVRKILTPVIKKAIPDNSVPPSKGF